MGDIREQINRGATKVKHKLCFVIPEYDPKTTTHFAYLPEFIRELSRDLDIFLIIERGQLPVESFGCSRIELVQSRNKLMRMIEVKLKLFKVWRMGYKDFYIHYSFFAAYIASILACLFGGRVLYWNCGEPWKYKRNIFRNWFERLVYKQITYLVTGTDSLKKKYSQYYKLNPEKIKVMPNWIDIEAFSVNIDTEKLKQELNIQTKYIALFVHRLSKRKGAHYLPEIMNQLNDVTLFIAGDGPLRKKLEKELLGKNARFLNLVPHSALPRYFAVADIFLLPSDEEGFPHVLLEAMASKTPYVAFNVGGVSEITPPELASNIVDAKDIESFVRAVSATLQTPRLVDYTGWLQQYSLENIIKIFKSRILN
jgi:glycosyltransferase involved in cell wall biosynthesis